MWHQIMCFFGASQIDHSRDLLLLLASSRQGIPFSKGNEQAIKQIIFALYDQVFIQQSILEVGLRYFGTPCKRIRVTCLNVCSITQC